MNYRLLSAVVALFISAALISSCGGGNKTASEHLDSAQEYYDQEEYSLATVELKNAIRKDSSLADAYFLQARIYEKEKQWESMHAFLNATLQQEPKHIEANLEVASLYARVEDSGAAQRFLDLAIEAGAPPFDVALTEATIYLHSDQFDNAKDSIKRALSIKSDSETALAVQATIELERNSPDSALSILSGAIKRHPESERLLLLLSRAHTLNRDFDQAAKQTLKLIEINPDNLEHYYLRAALLTQAGNIAGAESALRLAVDNNPDNPSPKIVLAGYINSKNQRERAIELLNSYISNSKATSESEIKLILAELYEQNNNFDLARNLYNEISQTDESSANVANNKLALLALREGRPEDALRIVNEILVEEFNNVPALSTRALVFMQSGKVDRAITDLLNALREQPESETALLLIGNAYHQANNTNQAINHLEKLVKRYADNIQGLTLYTQLLHESEQYAQSIRTLERAARQNDLPGLLKKRLLEAYLASQEWNKARNQAQLIAESSDQPDFPQYVDAYILQLQGKYRQSIPAFKKLIDNRSYASLSLSGLIKSLNALEKQAQSIEYLQQYLTRHPEDLHATSLLVTEYRSSGHIDKALDLIEKTLAQTPEWAKGHYHLATIYSNSQEWPKAIEQAEIALGSPSYEDSTTLMLILAAAHEQLGNADQAIDYYREVLKVDSSMDGAANNLALLLSRQDDRLDEAMEIASRFEESSNPAYLDTLGRIYYLRGDLQMSAALLEKAVFSAPNSPTIHLHLGETLLALEEFEDAAGHLEKAIDAQPGESIENKAKELLDRAKKRIDND